MATIYIDEFIGFKMGGPAAKYPPIKSQIVAITGSTTQSVAFSDNTNYVRIHCDAICSIAFGSNPVATALITRLAASQTEYFEVTPGHLLAVIQNV